MELSHFPRYPRISRKDFTRWNERMFVQYNNERVYNHPNPLIRYVENTRVKAILSLLSPVSGTDKILAAGCGEGYIEKKLQCKDLCMVDLSKEAIRRAKMNRYPSVKTTFHIANLEKTPFKANSFDSIECSEVVEHVYSPEELLAELARVVKPSGKLVISFPNEPLINKIKRLFIKLGIFHLMFPNVPKDMTAEWHLHAFSLEKFRKVSSGLWDIGRVIPVPCPFLPIRYVVLCRPLKRKSKATKAGRK